MDEKRNSLDTGSQPNGKIKPMEKSNQMGKLSQTGKNNQIQEEQEEYEIIDLTPDMSKVWGQILRNLRETKDNILYTACVEQTDLFFGIDSIEITCRDDATYNLLNKYKSKLEKFAGQECINIWREKKKSSIDRDIIERLERLFAGRLTVKQ